MRALRGMQGHDRAFAFVRAQYDSGLMDAVGPLLGRALDEAMAEAGKDMEDLLMRMEAVSEDAVERADRLAGRWAGPILVMASNRRMAGLQARLLRCGRVQDLLVGWLRRRLVRFLRSAPPPPDGAGGVG